MSPRLEFRHMVIPKCKEVGEHESLFQVANARQAQELGDHRPWK